MDRLQALVRAFHLAMDAGAPAAPSLEGFPGPLRVALIDEEAAEFARAVADGDVVEMIDALCDLLYVTYGAAVSLGVDLEPFFDEVHRSNMAKVDGPVREDGKRLKPLGWQPPRIREILEQQIASAVPKGGTPPG